MRLHGEYSLYPWVRYGGAASSAWRLRAELSGAFSDGSSAQLLLRDYSGKVQARLGGTWAVTERISLGARVQGGPGGGATFLEGGYSAPRGRWGLWGRVTAWNTDGWDNRIAFYEKGLPQSYSVRQFYGKGTGAYLLLKAAPVKGLEGWLRVSDDYFAFLILSFIPG